MRQYLFNIILIALCAVLFFVGKSCGKQKITTDTAEKQLKNQLYELRLSYDSLKSTIIDSKKKEIELNNRILDLNTEIDSVKKSKSIIKIKYENRIREIDSTFDSHSADTILNIWARQLAEIDNL